MNFITMRKAIFFLALSLWLIGCKESGKSSDANNKTKNITANYKSFGAEISAAEAKNKDEIGEVFANLKPGDTLATSLTTSVKSVCKKKGCWMILNVPGEEVRVTFKNYGFFVPKDIENREVVVAGKAFVEEISVEDLRHYAKDEGKSEAEIAAITKPELTRSFIAEGVLLKE